MDSPHARNSDESATPVAPSREPSGTRTGEGRMHPQQQQFKLPTGLRAGLGPIEVRRRIWHMAPGLLPFLLWPIPHRDPLSPTLQIIMIGLCLALGAWIFFGFRHIARNGRINDRISGVGGYAGSVLATLLLFPQHAEMGLMVLGVLAFGDGAATLGGLLLRGPALPWNHDKTWAGFFTFLGIGIPLASLIYWGESHNLEALQPGVSFSTALVCGGIPVTVSALAESIKSPINDNIRVGITSAVAVVVTHGLLVGL